MYQIVYLKYQENGYPREIFLERNNAPREELEQLLLNEGYVPFFKNTEIVRHHSEPQYFFNFNAGIEAWIFPNEKNFRHWQGNRINCIVDAWKD